MSNEEILADISRKHRTNPIMNMASYQENTVIRAMNAARRDEAVRFEEWQQSGDCDWQLNDYNEWFKYPATTSVITTEQLYEIFKQQDNG